MLFLIASPNNKFQRSNKKLLRSFFYFCILVLVPSANT